MNNSLVDYLDYFSQFLNKEYIENHNLCALNRIYLL